MRPVPYYGVKGRTDWSSGGAAGAVAMERRANGLVFAKMGPTAGSMPEILHHRPVDLDQLPDGKAGEIARVKWDGRLHVGPSGLVCRVSVDPKTYPRLSWSWKIVRTIGKGDARTRAGDEYAARAYVVFPSIFFWKTRAVDYIRANMLPGGAFLPNAYSANSVMVAVESGDANAGRWIDEERNLVEDFRRAFGEDPPEVRAVAIMTDADDTGEQAVAWYGAIRFLPPGR